MSTFKNRKTISYTGSPSYTLELQHSEFVIGDSQVGASGFSIVLPRTQGGTGTIKLLEGMSWIISDEYGNITGNGPSIRTNANDVSGQINVFVNGSSAQSGYNGALKVPYASYILIYEGSGTFTLLQGGSGAQGPTGTGTQGNQGPQGDRGFQGFQGRQGPQGDQGAQGRQGPQGDQGAQGRQGPQGDRGFQGFQGNQGPTGNGTQGFQGNQGPTGNGTQGFQGRQGPTGDASTVAGPQGRQGPTGDASTVAGPQGRQGPTGNTLSTSGTYYIQVSDGSGGVTSSSGMTGNTSTNIITASGFFQSSSRTLKTNIKDYTYSATDLLKSVNVVEFNYKNDLENKHIGFVAEDTPIELSTKNQNSMDTNSTVGILIKSIQELEARIKELETPQKYVKN